MDALKSLDAVSDQVRAAALALLDEVSAPLSQRQIARMFRASGLGPLKARRAARAMRNLDIIAIASRRG